MNKRATKRLREFLVSNRIMPLGSEVPFNLKADWRKMKKTYNRVEKPKRHDVLWKAVK